MRCFGLLLTGALLAGCGHVAVVDTTPEGRVQVEGALGGPVVNIGALVPVPLTTLGARYGLSDRVDVAAHAHLTPLAFGTLGADVGGAVRLVDAEGAVPRVTLSSRVYGFGALRGGALGLVEATVATGYSFADDRVKLYLAPTLLQPFASSPINFSVGAGAAGRVGNTEFQLEARWYQPTVDNRFAAANWVGISNQGALGFVLGARHVTGDPL